MRKPKLYKGLSYSFPEPGLIAFYVPNADQGSRLYVLKLSPQTEPIAYLLRRLIDEAVRPSLYERVKRLFVKPKPPVEVIEEKLGNSLPDLRKGRVVKATSAPEYTPNRPRGGRVTKAMPRQLRKIKEGQEASSELSAGNRTD